MQSLCQNQGARAPCPQAQHKVPTNSVTSQQFDGLNGDGAGLKLPPENVPGPLDRWPGRAVTAGNVDVDDVARR